jgi:hypothetical protein
MNMSFLSYQECLRVKDWVSVIVAMRLDDADPKREQEFELANRILIDCVKYELWWKRRTKQEWN